jgi:hypothetical protein
VLNSLATFRETEERTCCYLILPVNARILAGVPVGAENLAGVGNAEIIWSETSTGALGAWQVNESSWLVYIGSDLVASAWQLHHRVSLPDKLVPLWTGWIGQAIPRTQPAVALARRPGRRPLSQLNGRLQTVGREAEPQLPRQAIGATCKRRNRFTRGR